MRARKGSLEGMKNGRLHYLELRQFIIKKPYLIRNPATCSFRPVALRPQVSLSLPLLDSNTPKAYHLQL